MTEIVVILVIALLIFGPNRLPELARSLGRGFGEFRRASYDLRQSLMEAGEPDPPAGGQKIHPPESTRTEAAREPEAPALADSGEDAAAQTTAAAEPKPQNPQG